MSPTPQTPYLPPQNVPVMDRESPTLMSKPWWIPLRKLFDAFNALGSISLLTVGAMVKVTGPGAIGEAWFKDTQVATLVRAVQANLAALAATLGATQAGLMVEVTDFRHILQWTGSAWKWGPGEDGRHDIVGLPVDPDDTTGWQLCDGSTVAYLKGDGTTSNYTTPDLVSAANKAAYLKLGTPVSGPNAATAPTFAGGALASASTGITATTSATGTTQLETIAGGSSVPTAGHTHAVNISDPTHTHTFSGGTVGSNGEPRNMELRPWFRL